MRILNKYLAKEIGLIFLICLFSFLIFILIGKLLHLKNFLFGQSVSLLDIVELFIYLSPSFLIILIPASCMLSVFLSFLKMSSDRELIALQACGISFKNLFFFPLFFSILCCLVTFYTSFFLIPKGIDSFRNKCVDIIKSRTQLDLRPGIFISNFTNMLIYFQNLEPKNNIMEHVFIKYNRSIILASKGKVEFNTQNKKAVINLENGKIYNINLKNNYIVNFKLYNILINLKSMFGGLKFNEKKPKEMYSKDIYKLINSSKDKKIIRIAKMELQRRIALPLSCFILVLFILPFASSMSGIKQQFGIIFCLLFFIIYYSLYTLFYSLGETGKINPNLAMWMPNIIFMILSFINFYISLSDKYNQFIYKFIKILK
ncbi:MAG: LptF/LptG family permease [Desulfonauticus sp.]|nr:LptF/LptG family permease [Desulfonauticus sp.]